MHSPALPSDRLTRAEGGLSISLDIRSGICLENLILSLGDVRRCPQRSHACFRPVSDDKFGGFVVSLPHLRRSSRGDLRLRQHIRPDVWRRGPLPLPSLYHEGHGLLPHSRLELAFGKVILFLQDLTRHELLCRGLPRLAIHSQGSAGYKKWFTGL